MGKTTFRRYTSLPFLLDILHEKRLPLLDPATWEDKNDSYYLELYKKAENLKSVLTICFAEAPETYHHWKIYAGNSSGVCIEFHKDKLLNKFKIENGYLSDKITYKFLHDTSHAINTLPFIKRVAFKDEEEYRVLYIDPNEEIKVKYLPIISTDIEQIIINPWVNMSVFKSIKTVIKNIDGFSHLRVTKSTVVENEQWKKQGEEVVANQTRSFKLISK